MCQRVAFLSSRLSSHSMHFSLLQVPSCHSHYSIDAVPFCFLRDYSAWPTSSLPPLPPNSARLHQERDSA
jgi:hypothetical protein